jgi:hypothetical protein
MPRLFVVAVVLVWCGAARAVDCDLDGVDDATEIASSAASDCNANGIPDTCDLFPVSFTASSSPLAGAGGPVVSAELTGDRPVDLAVLNPGAGTVSILAGGSDGTFTLNATVTVGSGPEAIAASSLQAAVISLGSDIDLMVANGAGNSVSVLRNAGDGTFTNVSGSPFALAGHPNGIAVGDLDGDGEPDLVVSRRDTGGVSVFLNDGSGGISPSSYFASTGAGARGVIVTDIDGDGFNDALVANQTAGTVSYLRNAAGAAFFAAVTVATVGDPIAIALADVDADGHLDLGVLSGADGRVHLFLGDGAGTFTPGTTVAAASDGTGLQLVDMDGNGSPDVVVPTSGGNAVILALGNASGTFGPSIAVPASAAAAGVVGGDFDADGRADLAVPDGSASFVRILRGGPPVARDCDASAVLDTCEAVQPDCNGNGIADTCDAVTPLAYEPAVLTTLADIDPPVGVGDLDGDGRADLVIRRTPPKLVIALGQADGTLVESGGFVVPNTPTRILLTDVDGDGDRDIVATSGSGNAVYVLRNDGHGGVVGTDVYPEPNGPFAVVAGEFTGDANVDLLVSNSGASSLTLLPGTGGGGFTVGATITLDGHASDLVVGDVDGDGDADVVALVIATGGVTELQIIRNGGGTLTAEAPILVQALPSALIGLGGGDFDGDGDLDLVLLQFDIVSSVLRIRVGIAAGGTYTDGQTLPFAQLPPSIGLIAFGLVSPVTADLDGDGHPDVALPALLTGGVAVLRGRGDGTFDPMQTIPVGGIVRGLSLGDVTGDGAPDLVVPQSGSLDEIAVVPGLARPAIDTNADGVPDCRQELRCGDCADDDGDGLVDGADPDCPGTTLRIRRVVIQPAHGRKPARAKLVADATSPATFDPAATGFGFTVAAAPTYCGTPPLRARGKRVLRLNGADGALGALAVQSRPKGKGFRVSAALAPVDPTPAAGDVVHAWVTAGGQSFRGDVTLRAKGKRLVGP